MKTVKNTSILPLGDSITDGYNYPGGYRIRLYELLKSEDMDVIFLGSMENGPLPDKRHEGHSGWTIEEINSRINYWLSDIEPDIILLLIGTNNIAMLDPPESALKKLEILVNNITELKPESFLIAASIPPVNDSFMNNAVQNYNSGVKRLCEEFGQNTCKIEFADVFSALDFSDLYDGAHPNKQGHEKIAEVFYEALLKIISKKTDK